MTNLRLIFMGSPEFAVPTLAALLRAGHHIACVYAQPPRAAGRGQRLRPTAVHAFAEAHGLDVRTPRTLKEEDAQRAFAALAADAAVVAAYGLILPPPVLAAPRLGCFNLHGSLLPRWRGAAPIQRAILAGDTETGVTIMQMEAGLDTGPMLLSQAVPITPTATAASLHDTLATLGAELMVVALEGVAAGTIRAVKQPEQGVTYAPKLERDEGRLDWQQSAADLDRRVRAFDPWPGAWFEVAGERIKVLSAAIATVDPAPPGTVTDDRLTIACGRDALRPLRVQRAGRAVMDTDAFLRGTRIAAGTVLG